MKASQILTMAGAVALILVAQVILPAVLDLFLSLEAGRSWRVVHDVAHCNGLVVLERVR